MFMILIFMNYVFINSEIKSTMAIHTHEVWGKLEMSVRLSEMRLNNLRNFPQKRVHMCITKQRCGQALAPCCI